jgi:hypothetical protein
MSRLLVPTPGMRVAAPKLIDALEILFGLARVLADRQYAPAP